MLAAQLLLLQYFAFANGFSFYPFNRLSWNLNWLRQTDLGHVDSRENKRPEQRIELIAEIFDSLNQLGSAVTPCESCKLSLEVLKQSSDGDNSALSAIFHGICGRETHSKGFFRSLCDNLHLYESSAANSGFSFLPDFANALSEMDTEGIDGEYLCHYMFSNACPRPATPKINYETYWAPKPASKQRVSRSDETFNVLHVSDVHLSANYTEYSPANCLSAMCCDSFAIQNPLESRIPAPKFGHWRCDCPQALLDSAVADSATRVNQAFKFALFTGDMVDHNPVFISREETYIEEERTMRSLKSYLGNLPVYPVLGNHDSYPYSQEAPKDSKYADRSSYNIDLMQHMWLDFGWIDGKASAQVKQTHGAYAIEPMKGLKVITLNSNYWYRWNFYNYVGMEDPDPSGIIQFLISELTDCEERGLKAWVQAHVPPGGLMDEALPPVASFLTATLDRFSDVITGLFFGHTHLDEFSVLYSHNATEKSEDRALNVAWVAPSITPFTDLNPGWRYYTVNSATFEIMDSVTVYADIESRFGVPWSETPDLDWKVLYSAREIYGTALGWPTSEPLNGRFWHRVAKEFLSNAEFSEKFVRRSYRNSGRAPECSDYDCRSERYCYATSMTPDQVAHCHELHYTGERWKAGRHRLSKSDTMYRIPNKVLDRMHKVSLHGFPSFPMPRPKRYNKQKPLVEHQISS